MAANYRSNPMQCTICRQWYSYSDIQIPFYDEDGNFVCRKCRKASGNYFLNQKKKASAAAKPELQGEQLTIE